MLVLAIVIEILMFAAVVIGLIDLLIIVAKIIVKIVIVLPAMLGLIVIVFVPVSITIMVPLLIIGYSLNTYLLQMFSPQLIST